MEVTVVQALIIAIWIAAVMSRALLGGATTTLRFTPMMTGLVVGVVFGRIAEAMIVTASIQLIYMGVFSPGGQMPSEPAIAAGVAVPVALLSNMSAEAAIAIAVPVGLLGSYLYQLRFFINTLVLSRLSDKYAAESNSKMLSFTIIGLPIIIAFIIYVPFMFVALYFGAPVIADIVGSASGTVIFHVLTTIGGGLAAIGIAVTVYVIGKKNYIAFFLLAYFCAVILKSLNVTMITYAIVGGIIAFIYVLVKTETLSMVKATSSASSIADDDDDDY
ncbi:phosphotransferase system PTS sorbose-specific IIC subunit [Coriobacterium glomerans PW2]|uniref:Phosphotransferase system PTS sorbose-specific IIC subunit n=1 Tax=Coriobacterium glomerans (strain ATCC 49209 / DSM 20642 / JCM 10262 / PW2) TaxID=700015 RepID=F2N7I4_CORGP|nr:PTS sugar transporter subunit IIC [Coriobacterium glomerans]AEB06800.1 phosphotransferase system PTS sorbose-specific IIC subunit [Coriobacterium glomerans PW2]